MTDTPPRPKFCDVILKNRERMAAVEGADEDNVLDWINELAEQLYIASSATLSPEQAYERATDMTMYQLWVAQELWPPLLEELWDDDDDDDEEPPGVADDDEVDNE